LHLARQKRKAEKEAKAALEKREEEERNRRKAEKLRDMVRFITEGNNITFLKTAYANLLWLHY
jgi:hypothetical protein